MLFILCYWHLLKGKLFALTCQFAHLTTNMSLSVLWKAHRSDMSHKLRLIDRHAIDAATCSSCVAQ